MRGRSLRQIATTGDACVEVMYYSVHDETALARSG